MESAQDRYEQLKQMPITGVKAFYTQFVSLPDGISRFNKRMMMDTILSVEFQDDEQE